MAKTLELLGYHEFYHIREERHLEVLDEPGIENADYDELLRYAYQMSRWSEILHFYGASAAIEMPTTSFMPVVWLSHPQARAYNRTAVGRSVRSTMSPQITLMWPSVERQTGLFRANHFVLLQCKEAAIATTVLNDADGDLGQEEVGELQANELSQVESLPQQADDRNDHTSDSLADNSNDRTDIVPLAPVSNLFLQDVGTISAELPCDLVQEQISALPAGDPN